MKLTKKELLEKIKNDSDDVIYSWSKIEWKKARTYKQVKYYWWVIVQLVSNFTWEMPLEVNNQNKILFWKTTFTDLEPSEFETAMSWLRQFYNFHLGLNIPKPNEENFNYEL